MGEMGDPNPPEDDTSDAQVADHGNVQLEEAASDVNTGADPGGVQPENIARVRGDQPLVLITGATGFIGMHILNELVQAGEYRVRAVVRDAKGVKQLESMHPQPRIQLDIVKANIRGHNGFTGLLADCSYIIHGTNPTLALLTRELSEDDIVRKSAEVRYIQLNSIQFISSTHQHFIPTTTCTLCAGKWDGQKTVLMNVRPLTITIKL